MFFRLESLFDKSFHGSCLLLSPFNNENACRDSTATEFLPLLCILHSWRSERFAVKYQRWCVNCARRDLYGVLSNEHS
jgi:hypothetical protein